MVIFSENLRVYLESEVDSEKNTSLDSEKDETSLAENHNIRKFRNYYTLSSLDKSHQTNSIC